MKYYGWLVLPINPVCFADWLQGWEWTASLCFVLGAETRMTIKGYPTFLGPVQVKMPWDSWHLGKEVQANLSKGAEVWRLEDLQAIEQRIRILVTGIKKSVSLRARMQRERMLRNVKGRSIIRERYWLHNWSSVKACTVNHGIMDTILVIWVKEEVWYHFQECLVDKLCPLLW